MYIRNTKTGVKKEFPAWSEDAFMILQGKTQEKEMLRMKEIRYLSGGASADSEVYAQVSGVTVDALKQTTGIPKLDCSDILPADLTLLRVFQGVVGADNEGDSFAQRFVMKPKWYRILDTNGTVLNCSDITEVIKPGMKIDIEYHMNYVRIVGPGGYPDKGSPCGDPIVRKIIVQATA